MGRKNKQKAAKKKQQQFKKMVLEEELKREKQRQQREQEVMDEELWRLEQSELQREVEERMHGRVFQQNARPGSCQPGTVRQPVLNQSDESVIFDTDIMMKCIVNPINGEEQLVISEEHEGRVGNQYFQQLIRSEKEENLQDPTDFLFGKSASRITKVIRKEGRRIVIVRNDAGDVDDVSTTNEFLYNAKDVHKIVKERLVLYDGDKKKQKRRRMAALARLPTLASLTAAGKKGHQIIPDYVVNSPCEILNSDVVVAFECDGGQPTHIVDIGNEDGTRYFQGLLAATVRDVLDYLEDRIRRRDDTSLTKLKNYVSGMAEGVISEKRRIIQIVDNKIWIVLPALPDDVDYDTDGIAAVSAGHLLEVCHHELYVTLKEYATTQLEENTAVKQQLRMILLFENNIPPVTPPNRYKKVNGLKNVDGVIGKDVVVFRIDDFENLPPGHDGYTTKKFKSQKFGIDFRMIIHPNGYNSWMESKGWVSLFLFPVDRYSKPLNGKGTIQLEGDDSIPSVSFARHGTKFLHKYNFIQREDVLSKCLDKNGNLKIKVEFWRQDEEAVDLMAN